MPTGDRTGPTGLGPMTGRALGFCAGYDSPGYTREFVGGMGRGYGFRGGRGNGFGRGRGMGYGWGRYPDRPYPGALYGFPYSPFASKEDEIKMLRAEAEYLKRSQKDIEKRLSELENEKERGKE
ncbi:MAG: DUF5320 domain-containing protein [Bacteroidales bacterium]|nr:DUF5320 domain-containing protein [Bacteroidales bacterium]